MKEFSEYYGIPALIQLDEPIPMTVPTQAGMEHTARINELGEPQFGVSDRGQPGIVPRGYYPVALEKDSDAGGVFAANIIGRLMPAADPAHVLVLYETKSEFGRHAVQACVKTSNIISVSIVVEEIGKGPSRIVTPSS